MEYNYLLPRKKERRGRRRKIYVSVSFLPCEKAIHIVARWRKKTAMTLNKGVKRGQNHGIGEDNNVNGGEPSQRGINLAVTPKIRELGKAPFWGAITLTIPD